MLQYVVRRIDPVLSTGGINAIAVGFGLEGAVWFVCSRSMRNGAVWQVADS